MKTYSFLFFLLFSCSLAYSQNSYSDHHDYLSVSYNDELQSPSRIVLDDQSSIRNLQSREAIAQVFEVDIDQLKFKNKTKISESISIDRYQRYIDGIRVAHGSYTVLIKNNKIDAIHAEHYSDNTINHQKTLSKDEALSKVLPRLGSDLYGWEATAQLLQYYTPNSRQYIKLQEVLLHEYPSGEEVYVKDYYTSNTGLQLAYLYTIESVVPEFRDRVYVSAEDGRILLRDPQLKHGTGDTRYSGNRSFPTTEVIGATDPLYQLKGIEPTSGVLCETRSLEGLGGLPISTPAFAALSDSIADGDDIDPCLLDDITITDEELGDDIWNKNEHRKVPFDTSATSCCPVYVSSQCDEVKNDDIALDAHWGAATVVRYWKDIHDRIGYDGNGAPINSYVHHGLSHENATWNGMIMKYGDGAYQDGTNPGGMFGPLVSLDVCAHEIGHALCTSTSDLVYIGEPGAMNEGLSDIWGAAVEGYVLDSIDGSLDYVLWSIGEHIDERDGGLFDEPGARAVRWLDHPPAENNPDTYGAGTWWQDPDCASPSVANDFCGIHFNSGVLNKWFYLLTEGSGQAYSPGLNKPAFDDEINDKGHTYSVNGIGLRKSEKIIFGANLLLSPNSKFADMRAASIDIARSIFGPCSDEVEQTIRAWYGVGVGPDFDTCLPTVEFNQFNIKEILETSIDDGCSASTEVNLSIFSYMANTTVDITTSGNAVEGDDYELCFTSMTFSGDEEKLLKIIINDDKIEEGNDTLIVNIAGGGYSDSDTIIIINDDGIPAIGSLDTLLHETFDINDNSWQQELVNPTSLLNEWFVDAFNSNQAHISYQPSPATPTYTQVVESHIRLKSPQINAIGRKNVGVNFTYSVGGERDLVDPAAIFDYGTFEISYDGFDWEEVEVFVGDTLSGGIVIVSDTFDMTLTQLDNSTFYLGYTWYNDALNGSAYSFMFDNVVVTGEGLEIESEVGGTMEAQIPSGSEVGFISVDDNEVIAIIEDTNADLGCTSIEVVANDDLADNIASTCNQRGTKVYEINTENETDSVLLKLYYKESEIDDWGDFTNLNILAVYANDIDDESAGYQIIDNTDITISDHTNSGNGFVTFTFWISTTVHSLALTDRPATPSIHWVNNLTDSNPQSMRNMIQIACPEDTIKFMPITDGNQITLTSSTIDIDKDLHIVGNGVNQTMIFADFGTAINVLSDTDISIKGISIRSVSPHTVIDNHGHIVIKEQVEIGQ